MDVTKSATSRNLAYVQKICERNEYISIETDEDFFYRSYDVLAQLEALLADEKNMFKPRTWKYLPLTDYFERLEKKFPDNAVFELEAFLSMSSKKYVL